MANNINQISVLRKIDISLKSNKKKKEISSFLHDKALTAGRDLTLAMQKGFEMHPVTRELDRGADARTQISNFPTGPNGGRYGNLVAFFGLAPDKINRDLELLNALLSNFRIQIDNEGLRYQISIQFPPIEEYYIATPPPYGAYNVSWLEGMENASVQNFSQFLYTRKRSFKNSRTGRAIQVASEDGLKRGVQTMPKIPYISDIYNKILKDPKAKDTIAKSIGRRLKF